MAKKEYVEEEVVGHLNRKNDLRVHGKQILELKTHPGKGGTPARGDVGIKSKGKIDFLCRYHQYTHFYVDSFRHS